LLSTNGIVTLIAQTGDFGVVPTNWQIVGERDFDGDGKADLLWRDNLGNTAMWFMNGTQIASAASLGTIARWTVAAVADFNGDGKGDILWRDGSGNLAVWLMNGANIVTAAGLGNVPSTWSIVGTGDFNGDGYTDLLWRDTG
jgi:FG-GAP-like repeat/FG-GAP repeat